MVTYILSNTYRVKSVMLYMELNEQDLDTEPDDRTEDHTGDLSRYREQEQDQRQGCRHEQNQVQVQDWVQIQAQTRGKRQTSDGNQTADS